MSISPTFRPNPLALTVAGHHRIIAAEPGVHGSSDQPELTFD